MVQAIEFVEDERTFINMSFMNDMNYGMDSFFTLILILLVCYKILYVKFAHMGRVLGFNVGKLDGGYGCYMGWVQDSPVAMEKTLHDLSFLRCPWLCFRCCFCC